MIEIKISHGLTTKISNQDLELVSKYNWFAYRIAGTSHTGKVHLYGYKVGKKLKISTGKYKKLWLHNYIMNPNENQVVDHINGDPLDNRRENLRLVSKTENTYNRGKRKNGTTSKYLGVSKRKSVFLASITKNGKNIHLGYFKNEIDAAIAYNTKATELFGEFARLNEIK